MHVLLSITFLAAAVNAAEPMGTKAHTGSFTVKNPEESGWKRPPFVYKEQAATGRKHAKVIVVIYDPVLESAGGKRLTETLKANDSVEFSHILANVIREASWGYINYEIVDVITVDGYPKKVDGFRYTDETFLAVRKTQKWQPAPSSYRNIMEENGLIERCRREGITELWLWGAGGMHFDEFAMYIPNRYTRFAPTDNPWFYRPYDIPPEIDRTFWIMGFNYEVGADNMIHSYTHRVESMIALQFGNGVWDPRSRRDPWNVFTFLEVDHPGKPSQVGNCHFPPNGQQGYDYANERRTLSWADRWYSYPDIRGKPRLISRWEWGGNQFGYQKWILEHLPKYPGATKYGYNNWWVYIANVDEDLPAYEQPATTEFLVPEDMPMPQPQTLLVIEPTEDNPRNSEGDVVELRDGKLVLVYTRFRGGAADNAKADICARTSTDGGTTWGANRTLVTNEGAENTMSVSILRRSDGELLLFYIRKNSWNDCNLYVRRSADEFKTLSDPVRATVADGYHVINNDRVVAIAGDRLLIPAALHPAPDGTRKTWSHRGIPRAFLSDDGGRTWRCDKTVVDPPPKRQAVIQEPGIIERRDGSLWMWMRTTAGFQYACESTDRGETWSEPHPTRIASPCSPASIERVPWTGDLLMVFNDHSGWHTFPKGRRTPLCVALSKDDGTTWSKSRIIEPDPDGWYCYTSITFVGDRAILSYCAGDRKVGGLNRLKVLAIPKQWLYPGK